MAAGGGVVNGSGDRRTVAANNASDGIDVGVGVDAKKENQDASASATTSRTQQQQQQREEELLLLDKLKSQFGDLDLSSLTSAVAPGGNLGSAAADCDAASCPSTSVRSTDNDDGGGGESDDSSIMHEPTPDELKAWQEAQYKLGRWAKEAAAEATPERRSSAAEARRMFRRERRLGAGAGSRSGGEDDDGDWVHIPPTLGDQSSAFFPSSSPSSRRRTAASSCPSNGDNDDDKEENVALPPPPILLSSLADRDPSLLGGEWRRLYSSSIDGLSFARLLDSIRGYDGPTVIFIGAVPSKEHSIHRRQSRRYGTRVGGNGSGDSGNEVNTETATLGVVTVDPWKDHGAAMYGTDDCFLFRFVRESEDDDGANGVRSERGGGGQVRAFRPLARRRSTRVDEDDEGEERNKKNDDEKQRKYLYLHPSPAMLSNPSDAASAKAASKTSSSGRSSGGGGGAAVHGLGVGGTPSRPRLHLTEHLEGCWAYPADASFDDGPLLPPSWGDDCLYRFDVDALELWGVGGPDWINAALDARNAERSRWESTLRAARTIDKAQLVDDLRSGFFTDGGGGLFGHVEQVAGRLTDDDDANVHSCPTEATTAESHRRRNSRRVVGRLDPSRT